MLKSLSSSNRKGLNCGVKKMPDPNHRVGNNSHTRQFENLKEKLTSITVSVLTHFLVLEGIGQKFNNFKNRSITPFGGWGKFFQEKREDIIVWQNKLFKRE